MSLRQIWIVDFGSQYTQLITRKTRELGFSSEIITVKKARQLFSEGMKPKAIVLSGGPQSVFEDENDYSFILEQKDLPILGVCYGMQLLGKYFGGIVEKGTIGEYGHASLNFQNDFSIEKVPDSINVWMSHSDHISKLPNDFKLVMSSNNGLVAAIKHDSRPILGLQFHPEVEHSSHGKDILNYFFAQMAGLEVDWSASEMLDEAKQLVKGVEKSNVLCAFSGGVDSLVAATLAHEVIGENLYCFFVDHGLLRPQDYHHIETLQKNTPLNIEVINVKEEFLAKLAGKSDPEEKRKTIGKTFIEVFEKKVHEYENERGIKFDYLLQGTLYPDVIESISPHDFCKRSFCHHQISPQCGRSSRKNETKAFRTTSLPI